MRKRSDAQTGPCADAFSMGLGGQEKDVVPTPVVSGDLHSGPPPTTPTRAPMTVCVHTEFTRAVKRHGGAHRGEIHVRCDEPAVHQAKQARRHVLGPDRRGCMRIVPCAALNHTFRDCRFLLRPITGFSIVGGTRLAGTSFRWGDGTLC